MTRQECARYLKMGKGIPYKHKTLTRALFEFDKLAKIEELVSEWENSKVVLNCYECASQIMKILSKELDE